MTETMIEARGLIKRYGTSAALDGLDLRLAKGDALVLLGPNGAGKTTLLRCLLGLALPDGGEVLCKGSAPSDLSAASRARIGYVPQEFKGFGWMKAQALVHYLAGFYPAPTRERAEDFLRRFDVPPQTRVSELSVGQRQRMTLVLGLMHDPDFLVMDEPVAALDPGGRREVISLLLGDFLTPEKTILFSTHITSDAERIADRVAFLRKGRIVLDENLDALKERMRRVRVAGGADDPERVRRAADAAGLHCLRAEAAGQGVVLTVAEADEAGLAALGRSLNMTVTADFLNLEDLYLEINR
jgi:ABC-2 type transport system ATP-binding protein